MERPSTLSPSDLIARADIRAHFRYAQSGFRRSKEPQPRPDIDDAWLWKTNLPIASAQSGFWPSAVSA